MALAALLHALKHAIVLALQKLAGLGAVGKMAYVALLSMWTMLCLPTTPVEVAAGFIFPLVPSTTMSIVGKTCGSIGALFLGRRFIKPFISRLMGTTSPLYRHLLREIRQRPIQTMGLLRGAPLPTPLKIYGLSLLPAELVPLPTFAGVALALNTVWSLVWCLTGSSAKDLQGALDSTSSSGSAALVAKLFALVSVLGGLAVFGRIARARLDPAQAEAPTSPAPPASPAPVPAKAKTS